MANWGPNMSKGLPGHNHMCIYFYISKCLFEPVCKIWGLSGLNSGTLLVTHILYFYYTWNKNAVDTNWKIYPVLAVYQSSIMEPDQDGVKGSMEQWHRWPICQIFIA